MDYDTLASFATDRIISLVDQYAWHLNAGDNVNASIVNAEIKDLTSHLDDEDYDFFWHSYFRNLSDDFGMSFEIIHGDPELMFGGI
jgi:hypothetical protein